MLVEEMAYPALFQLLREDLCHKVLREDEQAVDECRALSRRVRYRPVPRYHGGDVLFGTCCTYFVWPNVWFSSEQRKPTRPSPPVYYVCLLLGTNHTTS